jgi:hypothetical protein
MKILDWCFLIYYRATLDKGSRVERANFLLWFASSFIWVALFYLILSLIEIRIGKFLFMPIFLFVFTANHFMLHRIYLKGKRGTEIIEKASEINKRAVPSRLFVFLSIFLAMAIMLLATVYYGKNIRFL